MGIPRWVCSVISLSLNYCRLTVCGNREKVVLENFHEKLMGKVMQNLPGQQRWLQPLVCQDLTDRVKTFGQSNRTNRTVPWSCHCGLTDVKDERRDKKFVEAPADGTESLKHDSDSVSDGHALLVMVINHWSCPRYLFLSFNLVLNLKFCFGLWDVQPHMYYSLYMIPQ